jgi:acyl-coenzyme A synthetase/AMP-(fatty) acid ligase
MVTPHPSAWHARAPDGTEEHGPTWRRALNPRGIDPDRSLFDLAAAAAARRPDAILAAQGRRLTLGEAVAAARNLAASLAAASPGAAAIILRDDIAVCVAILAVRAAARTMLLINANHPAAHIAAILEDAQPAVIVADPDLALPHGAWQIHHGIAAPPPPPGFALPPAMPPDGPAMVNYTSGSTGRPRGFVRSVAQVRLRSELLVAENGISPDDHIVTLLSASVGNAASWLTAASFVGCGFGVADIARFGMSGICQEIAAQRPTILAVNPSLMRLLAAAPGAQAALSRVRLVDTINEVLTTADVVAWRRVLPPGTAISSSFAMTEAGMICGWYLPPDLSALPPRVPIGYLRAGNEIAIIDDQGLAVPDGTPGTMWVRGPLVAAAEWRAGACVTASAIPDPHDPGRLILNSRDLVRRDASGMIHFLGRADDMVKVRGNRVEPAELEAALRRIRGIADAAVLAERVGEEARLAAFVVAAPGGPFAGKQVTWPAVRAALRPLVPTYMMPSRGTVLSVLPRLPNGKVDRAALLSLGLGQKA